METNLFPPPSAELLQKIEDLNAGLVSLKTLAGAVSQSEVRSLAETEDGVRLTFCDGTEVTVACNAAAEAPLIGIAVDGDAYYWTLAAEKDIPWLKDAAGAKMPVSGPVPVVGRDDKGFWTVTTDAAVTPWQIEDGSGNPVEATGDEQVELFRSVKAGNGRVEIALTDGGTLSAAQVNDLSVAGTANCYVVSAPGTYVFNARVRGNGAGEGVGFEPAIEMADGMTADWLWTDSEGLVSGVALDTTSGDIFLTVGEGRGNALVALMQDGKALQSGTSHFLGQNFAKAFDVTYTTREGKQEYVWATSWGVSTRLMGALIMAHSDNNGLVLPPKLAPIQVAMVPIYKGAEQLATMTEKMEAIAADLRARGISVKVDTRDNVRSGFKFAEYELKGVPVRLALGPRDLENGTIELARRDTLTKETVPQQGLADRIVDLLDQIQKNIYRKAHDFRSSMITRVDTWDEFIDTLNNKGGFISAHWDGTVETEVAIKDATKATIRCIPLDAEEEEGRCIYTGKPSHRRVLFARSY